jgi:hypothetical protein
MDGALAMTEIKKALLAVLMALGGHEEPATPPNAPASAPSALVAEHRALTPASVAGAWRGKQTLAGEQKSSPMEAVFVDAERPSKMLGYFTFGEGDIAPTIRRLGQLSGDRLVFTLRDGRELSLRFDDKREHLLGVESAATGPRSTFELARVRARPH